jgi:hypothetical protein
VRDAVVAVVAEQIPERGRGLEPRIAQLDGFERDRIGDLAPKPEPFANPGGRGLDFGSRRLLVLVAPAPVLSPAGRGRGRYQ